MSLNVLLDQIKDVVQRHGEQQNAQAGRCDTGALLAEIEALFAQHQQQFNPQYGDQPRGMDPYGGLPDEAGDFKQSGVRDQEETRYGKAHAIDNDPDAAGAGL